MREVSPRSGSLVERVDKLEVQPNSLGFYGLGQAGVIIRGPEGAIYVDPYLTDNDGSGGHIERNFPPPVDPADITNAAGVLISHVHIDHFDPQTLGPLAKSSQEARFYAPHTCDLSQAGIEPERTEIPEVDRKFTVGGASVTAIPSAHTGLEYDPERGYSYLGYVIEWNGITVYHSGDTVIYDGLLDTLRRWDIDVVFMPINGRDYFRTAQDIVGNTGFREVAELAETLDIRMTIPTHYDLIPPNTENPAYFVDYLYERNPDRHYHLLRPGELYYYVKEEA